MSTECKCMYNLFLPYEELSGTDISMTGAIGTKARAAPVGSGKGRNVWNATPPTTPDSV